MQTKSMKNWLSLSASTLIIAGLSAAPAFAQDVADTVVDRNEDVVITTGTRRALRSAADTPAPVDVITGIEFTTNASDDVQDMLRTSVPSYNVNTQPISDAASIVRPANLRGLSPDNTLVLVNGKRRHRGAVISFLGGGIADGAQGVDVSSIPSLALKQVEILRDGASSQYGSDAIAGVINFVLKDDAEGGTFEAKYGSTYAGDGDNYRIGGNVGLPLGDIGFINLTAEYGETDGTVRAAPRNDVNALIAAGNTDVADFRTINTYTDEYAQYWGQPDVKDDLKFLVNTALEIAPGTEVYATGTYAERQTTGGFFYRNPTNRGGVYAGPSVDADGNLSDDGGASVRVGDLDGLGVGGECPAGIPLIGDAGLTLDPTVLASVTADNNCFSFVEAIPGGFVPRFGGDLRDFGITAGLRGDIDLGTGLSYDLSITQGQSKVDFFINNTVNASLGPIAGSNNTAVQRNFRAGGQEQIETTVNADFGYLVDVGLASELSVAFGAEYRKEQFDLIAGEKASFELGPLADQGFSSSSNGFGGFPNSSSNSQDNIGTYIDLEADVSDKLTLQGAVRYEDFSDFDSQLTYKIAGLYRLTDDVSLRGTFSTGYHAPTAGQANITNVTTQNVNGVLIDQGTLPLNTAAGQLAADFVAANNGGNRPTLDTEDATNFSAGLAFNVGASSWTVDAFSIKVDNRIALGANVDFLDALNSASATQYTSIGESLTGLNAAGIINRADFAGLDDLSQFRFFSNSFDTKTQGIDVVGRYPFEMMGGYSNFILAANYTDTKVKNIGDVNPISDSRVQSLERLLPKVKGSATLTHDAGMFRGLLRANYYGKWDDTGNGVDDVSAEILVDAEITAEVAEGVDFSIGASNLFDNYPDENPGQGGSGQLYPEASPTGFNGGQYYAKVRVNF